MAINLSQISQNQVGRLRFSETFIVGRAIFFGDVFEHHVEFFLRIVGELQEEESVEGVVEVWINVEAQELRVDLEVFLEQRWHTVVAVAEFHDVAVELIHRLHIFLHKYLNIALIEVRDERSLWMEQLGHLLVGVHCGDVIHHQALVEFRIPAAYTHWSDEIIHLRISHDGLHQTFEEKHERKYIFLIINGHE